MTSPGFMFACTSGVIAKCIRWGYRPWKTVNGQPLADYHQACTRMARADYCGDGVSHTENGTLIDMFDHLQIQKRTPFDLKSPMLFDGAWTPNGAYCIGKQRWFHLGELQTFPSCQGKFKLPDLKPKNLFSNKGTLRTMLTASEVDWWDRCALQRFDLKPEQVLMYNRSGINVKR